MKRWGARRRFAAIAGIVAVTVWVPLIIKGVRNTWDGNDFTVLHAAALRLWAGESLYPDGGAFMYPPVLAILLLPLAGLTAPWAGCLWLLAKIPLFYYSAGVFIGAGAAVPSAHGAIPVRTWILGLSPLLVWRFLDSDLVNGNTNVYLLAGLAAALHVGRRSSAFGGALLGVLGAVRLSPIYLIPILGATGRVRMAAVAILSVSISLVFPAYLSPGGLEESWRGFTTVNRTVFQPEPSDRPAGSGYLPGQSLRALTHRWLRPIDATAHDHRSVSVNFAHLDPRTAEWCYRGGAMLLAAYGIGATWGRGLRWSLAWGSVILMLISPYTRKATFVLMLPAYLECVGFWIARPPPRRRSWVLGFLAISWGLGQLSVPALWGKSFAGLLLGYGVVGIAGLAILPAMGIIRRDADADAPTDR